MFRGDLTDKEWAIIGVLLPPERGRWARPTGDNRLFLNGMLDVLRTGCPWRDMHERYDKWNSVYVRFRRWAEQGVGDALLQTLVDIGLTDNWQHMIDSTIVRHPAPAARQGPAEAGAALGTDGTRWATGGNQTTHLWQRVLLLLTLPPVGLQSQVSPSFTAPAPLPHARG